MAKVYANIVDSPYCCGLHEVGNFMSEKDDTGWGNGPLLKDLITERYTALITTTIPRQRHAIAELKKLKFQPLRRFKGNEGNMITLWYLPPKRKR